VKTKPADHDAIEISVADNGPGLPSQVRDKLFQPFVTTKSNGMGVGLSVCKTIVEAHGGGLWAHDNAEGGTTFRFTVRRARP
jgi:two-component system, LuxR family, sensor kinase FixL